MLSAGMSLAYLFRHCLRMGEEVPDIILSKESACVNIKKITGVPSNLPGNMCKIVFSLNVFQCFLVILY